MTTKQTNMRSNLIKASTACTLFFILAMNLEAFFLCSIFPCNPSLKNLTIICNSVTNTENNIKTLDSLRLQLFLLFVTENRRLQKVCNRTGFLFKVTKMELSGYKKNTPIEPLNIL